MHKLCAWEENALEIFVLEKHSGEGEVGENVLGADSLIEPNCVHSHGAFTWSSEYE